jgi:hypothetical protein
MGCSCALLQMNTYFPTAAKSLGKNQTLNSISSDGSSLPTATTVKAKIKIRIALSSKIQDESNKVVKREQRDECDIPG